MKYIVLLILIAGSVGVFAKFIKPVYLDVQNLRNEVSTSGGSLNTAGMIKKQRDDLIAKYHAISKNDLDNLNALLPDSVNNIRLIIQINALANKNNLSTLRNVDYQTSENQDKNIQYLDYDKNYEEFTISFQTTGQYKNFLTFISDLGSNLRLVDIVGIDFSSADGQAVGSTNMIYKVTLKTYWLKQ